MLIHSGPPDQWVPNLRSQYDSNHGGITANWIDISYSISWYTVAASSLALVARGIDLDRILGEPSMYFSSGLDAGDLSVEANLSGYIDRILFTRAHLYYAGLYDPEGLLATLPAAVTVLSGYYTVKWLETQPVSNLTSAKLGLAGVIGILCGYIWGFFSSAQ